MIPDVSGAPQVLLCHHIPNLKPQATDMSLQVETLKLWVCFLFWKDEVGREKKIIIPLLVLFTEDEHRHTLNSRLIS